MGSGKRIHTDAEVMDKIKQLKESHEKTKKRNKLLEKEDAKKNLQIELLV